MKEWIPQFTHHKQCTAKSFHKNFTTPLFSTKKLQLLLFLSAIQDTPWLPVKADGDLIWDIRIRGIQRIGWLFHSPTQVKTCNRKNINENKIKTNTCTGKYRELSTKNTEYSHIPWNNFLYPPPHVIILVKGFRGWI